MGVVAWCMGGLEHGYIGGGVIVEPTHSPPVDVFAIHNRPSTGDLVPFIHPLHASLFACCVYVCTQHVQVWV